MKFAYGFQIENHSNENCLFKFTTAIYMLSFWHSSHNYKEWSRYDKINGEKGESFFFLIK